MTTEQQVAWVRDVPARCVCPWTFTGHRWVRRGVLPGCPWHTEATA